MKIGHWKFYTCLTADRLGVLHFSFTETAAWREGVSLWWSEKLVLTHKTN
jgi:hypothetical protein